MKKNIFLILGLLISCNLLAADVDHGTKTICEDQAKPQFKTTNTGDEYIWSKKNGNTWTQVATGSQTYTPTSAGEYQCEVKTNGGSFDTDNLITEGSFSKSCANTVNYNRVKNKQGDNVQYQLLNLNCSVGDYTSPGFTTIVKNAKDAKPTFFSNLTSASNKGEYFLVCDGSASSGVRIWEARDISLKKGVTYQFSCMVANVDVNTASNGSNSISNLEFRIEYDGNYGDGDLLMKFQAPSTPGEWEPQSTTFTPSQDLNYCHIHIRNHNTQSAGNDFALDDIYFGAEIKTSGSKKTEIFKLEIDTKPVITMPVIEDQCPNISVPITPTVTNAGSSPSYTWTGDSNARTKDISITSAATVGGQKKCTLEVTNGQCKTTGSITVKTKDCGRTETIDHPAVTVCTNQNVTLTCNKTGSSVKWSHDASLADPEITVTSSSTVGDANSYTCTITATENGSTVTYIENFTVKSKECSILYESTMCNTSVDSTLTTQKKGDKYIWTLPDGNIKEAVLDNIKISHIDANVGDKFAYSCEIYELPASNPNPSAPIAGLPPMLIATENFEITITDCNVETDDEKELQTKEDGSIRLFVPEANRCNGCTYTWYKRNADGTKGEPVVKNAGEQDWEHTVYNATEEEYVCEITSNGYRHVQSFKIKVYTPSTSKSCYNAESQEEQKETITGLPQGDRDEYEWYWMKDNQEIPFPEGSISTENNIITLNEDYFVQNGNANYPIIVHIVEKYSHKLEIKSNDTQKEENSTDILPDTENTKDTEDTGNTGFGVNISSSKLSKNTPRSNDSTFTYNYQIVDKASGETIDVADVFVVNPKCKYNETFPAKSAGMSSHDCNVRLTDKGINGCTAYKGDDPNNKYFIEVDGGDTAGPVFSIKQPGKLIKGKKYLLTFLVRETSTTSGNPPTTNPAKIDFKITINGQRYGITNEITITNQEWERREFNYIALDDEEEVIITVSNFTTSSGHNDFAIDDITFTLQEDIASRNALALRNATAYNNDEVVDEDGDGYVMWRAEHIHYIYPETTQTIVESSSPNVEFEKEITLPSGDQINFRYDPSIYDGVMTQYQDNTYKEDEHGCKHYAYFTLNLIELTPDLFFSPNGDGVHDRWMVEGIETTPNAHIMIYDRHSKLLYKTVASEFEGWDGTYNEKNMVQDDYWYVILVPETNETLSGHFTLKR